MWEGVRGDGTGLVGGGGGAEVCMSGGEIANVNALNEILMPVYMHVPMQGPSDLNADFRVKDVGDGSVCFESVTCPNAFIGVGVAAGLQTNLNVAEVVSTYAQNAF